MKHMWMSTSVLMLGTSRKVYHSERGKGGDKSQKTDVAGNCAAINLISFSYKFLCISLQLFPIPILCVAQIILQWNNKNLLKRPFYTWLWKGYMTSSTETVSVKRIKVADCTQSCLSRHQLLIIWRKTQPK